MDGVTLGAAAGGGYAAAAAILYFWPLVNGSPNLGGSVSGWTAALIAVLVVRPLIFCATTGLICAGVWSHTLSPNPNAVVVPVGSALVGTVVLTIGSLLLADQRTVVELIWNVVVMVALVAASRYLLTQALGQDRLSLRPERQALTPASNRVVCPTCGQPTRPGAFCANCGSPLAPPATPTPTTTPTPSTTVEVDVAPPSDTSPQDDTSPIGVPTGPGSEPPQ